MTDKAPESRRLVAVTNVAFDGAVHVPGAIFEAPEEIAAQLHSLGAARHAEEGDDAALERVNGIGPKTAAAMREAGVADLERLAGVPDEALPALGGIVKKDADAVRAWRDEARELLSQ